MTNKEEKEIDLISKITSVIVTWAKLNDYNPNDALKTIAGWLGTFGITASFEDYKPNWSCIIRALDDEALAEFIIDNAMHCSDAAELTEILKREVNL